jgi:hypothetical protein
MSFWKVIQVAYSDRNEETESDGDEVWKACALIQTVERYEAFGRDISSYYEKIALSEQFQRLDSSFLHMPFTLASETIFPQL